jgi:NADH dehydrogenase [ubiquinone] 1 alpha subcomplex assembly factor 7
MPVDRYMALCLGHPQHGYYMTRDPLGAGGDFTTSPEISQVFGELIGVWALQVWQNMGKPQAFALVELGPGRGTLMQDLLRATRRFPEFLASGSVHFVETSPVLRRSQAERVPIATWHDTIATLPALPTIVIANEFFDALPVQQFECREGQVFERVVKIEGDGLALGLHPSLAKNPFGEDGVFELAPARQHLVHALAHALERNGGAMLVFDYGHRMSAIGDTLQAMMDHTYCTILDRPGEADITSHVDFEALGLAIRSAGLHVHGLLNQGEFLENMGISLRAEMLARSLADEAKSKFIAGAQRLADPADMGQLFKVLAATSRDQPVPYPFGDV